MRPVSGFERPALQWLFVILGAVLVVVAVAEAVGLRRLRGEVAVLRASDLNGRIEREQLQRREAYERSAREALALEVVRLRGGTQPGTNSPTLTLSPLTKRGAAPPVPTVEKIPEGQPVQLRLLLPAGRTATPANYAIVVRTWSGGETIWSRSGLRASTIDARPMVAAFVTGDVFAPGAYEIALTTVSPDGKGTDVAAYEVAIGQPGGR
jgi:hypothetical protein